MEQWVEILGQLAVIALGAVAVYVPVQIRKFFAYRIVQDAALWAARKAVARLSNPDDTAIEDQAAAEKAAAEDLRSAAGQSLKTLKADAEAIVSRRVSDLLYGHGQ